MDKYEHPFEKSDSHMYSNNLHEVIHKGLVPKYELIQLMDFIRVKNAINGLCSNPICCKPAFAQRYFCSLFCDSRCHICYARHKWGHFDICSTCIKYTNFLEQNKNVLLYEPKADRYRHKM